MTILRNFYQTARNGDFFKNALQRFERNASYIC